MPPAGRLLLLALPLLGCSFLLGCAGDAGPGSATWAGWNGPDYPRPDEDLRGAAASLLSQAIQIDTSNPPGNERPLAEFLAAVAEKEGLEARVIETPGDAAPLGRAAVWARLPGKGTRPALILLSHLDVVPADAAEWTLDPFAGTVGGGSVVGRGALDAKGAAVVQLLVLAELRHRGIELDRDVIFLATPDEEAGGLDGAGWVVEHHRDLFAGAGYLLTEGGSILPVQEGGREVWGVAITEKTPCWIELSARGQAGHGSSPDPDAAPHRLVRALERILRYEPPIRVVPEVSAMYEQLAVTAEPDEAPRYRNLRGALALHPDFRSHFLADPARSALVRDTIAVTVLGASERVNVVPAEATARLDARLLPGESCPDFVATLRGIAGDPSLEFRVLLQFPAAASPIDTPLYRAIQDVAHAEDPHALVVPRVISGFTDAHWFRSEGIVSYGFVPRRLRPLESRTIHGSNERISIDNLVFGIDATIAILQQLDAEERGGS